MIGTLVRELSDGEELVVEGLPVRTSLDDPRERAIETRRLALDQQDDLLQQGDAS
jgi:hypothetical protein